MNPSPIRRFVLVLMPAVIAFAGCAERPSYELRWRVQSDVVDRPSPLECSSVGIQDVEILTLSSGTLVDFRRAPCFPRSFRDPERLWPGPELAPGRYEVQVHGLSRGGYGWPEVISYGTVNVRSNEVADVVPDPEFDIDGELALPAAPQCDDGIDNDHDGLLDRFDPACMVDASARESEQLAFVNMEFRTSFLGDNPNASCNGVRLAKFEVTIDPEPPGLRPIPWTCKTGRVHQLGLNLPGGDYGIELHGLDAAGQPVVLPKQATFSVVEGRTAYIPWQFDFAAEDFLALEGPARFVVTFGPDELTGNSRGCEPGPSEGILEIVSVTMKVVNESGQPVPMLTLDDETVLDGKWPLPCNIVSKQLSTVPLDWSANYRLEVEAYADDGRMCFSNRTEPAPFAPNEAFLVHVPRVDRSGSCADCNDNLDCGSNQCVDGRCVPY